LRFFNNFEAFLEILRLILRRGPTNSPHITKRLIKTVDHIKMYPLSGLLQRKLLVSDITIPQTPPSLPTVLLA
jgi:hypothetical protein